MIINKEKKQLYILLACGVLALAVSIWAFRMEKSTGMMVSAEIEDRSFTSGQDDKDKAKQAKQSKKEAFDTAYNALCLGGDAPTVQDIIEYYTEQNEDGEVQKPTSRTVYRWIKDYGYSLDKNSGKILNDTTCDMT